MMTAPIRNVLPSDAAARNAIPMADGCLDYFPNALAEVAKVSKIGNDQHNPGQPMRWDRSKSTDHRNKIVKHLVDAGGVDSDKTLHSAKVAWRALALLEDELIADGAVPGRNAINSPLEAIEFGGCAPPVYASAKDLYDETQVIAERQDRIDMSEKRVEFLTNREDEGTKRTHWKIEPNIKQHRRVVNEAERNAYLDCFGANPPNCDGNRPVMMAEADRLAGEGE